MHSIAVAEDYCLLIPIGYDPFANEKSNGEETLFYHNCYEKFHQKRPFQVKKESKKRLISRAFRYGYATFFCFFMLCTS